MNDQADRKYRTLFYHSKWNDKKWIDNAIALSTQAYNLWRVFTPEWEIVKMGLSHEEIWVPETFPCGKILFSESNAWHTGDYYHGTAYTSTMGQVGGKNRTGNGTVKRPASQVLKHPERWSYIEHTVPLWRFDAMMVYLDMEVRKNLGYGLGPKKNICSEISNNANITAGILSGPHKVVSPLTSALALVRAGGVLKRL